MRGIYIYIYIYIHISVPVVFCAACGRNAAAKFALSRNAFRKIWQFLIRNFKSGFESKIIKFKKKKHHGLQNLKLPLDSSAVTSQSQVCTHSIDWSKDRLIPWTVELSDG